MLMAAEGGAKKTHVMFKSNVNPLVLEKYLSFCVQNGLIAKDKLGYTTTAKGLKLIKCLNQISDLRKNLGEVESEVDKLIRNPPWEDQQ
jgi:predicted transcriptional regulator